MKNLRKWEYDIRMSGHVAVPISFVIGVSLIIFGIVELLVVLL